MAQNTCYFSKKCRFCQGFLEELARSPFSKEVRLVCVDPSPSRGPLPAWLKVVPTMILGNGEEPLIGPQAVNNWLFTRRLMQSQNASASETKGNAFKERAEPIRVPEYSPDVNVRPSPAPKTNSNGNTDPSSAPSDGTEPLPWHSAEMGGGNISDAYSFVEDSFNLEKGVNRITYNFEYIGGAAGPVGAGSASVGAGPAKVAPQSAKEAKLLKEFEAFSKMRDMEFTGPKRIG
jgi:hypothetical protein